MTSPDNPLRSGPVRTCVGCRERAAKRELLRVTLGIGQDGRQAVLPDPEGTAPGRGAHVHPSPACLELAVRRRAFGRALRMGSGSQGPSTEELRAHLALSETE
ncbi:YlxR family protein [Marmoricola sp. RAF53]|uniref:YlxR family protein n=1 Tax=Marmoricola sp. RAF53 TaxID=3233059 RepID=UPI003F96F63A